MNNFWNVFFKTLNPTLNWLTVISVILVFCLDIWLFEIEAPCQFFVACGKFFYGVGLSFIAAYIFYLITVHYPETHKAKIIYKSSDFPAMAIVTNIEGIFFFFSKKQGRNIDYKVLNADVIKELLSSTQCTGDSTLSSLSNRVISPKNWLEYISSKEDTYRSFINEVRLLLHQLDYEYIVAISEIEQFSFSKPIIGMYHVSGLTSSTTLNLIEFETFFLDIYQKSQALRLIIEERRIRYKY